MAEALLLSHNMQNKHCKLSKEQLWLLEADLLTRFYHTMLEHFRASIQEYVQLLKPHTDLENTMLENNFLRCLVHDILRSQEYTLNGIAYYTDTSLDVIEEILLGINTNPSLQLARKLIELHRHIRPDLYREILNKILREAAEPCHS